MNYQAFLSSTVAFIQKYFGEEATVSLHSIVKNNNICLDGLIIQDKSFNIAPTIYLNHYYEDYLRGKPLSAICDEIIAAYREHLPSENVDFSFFFDYDRVRNHLIYKLVNYEANAALLQDIPHFRFLDLAVVFCFFLLDTTNGDIGDISILIHNHHLTTWGITKDDLYETTKKNTPILLPYELCSIEEPLRSLYPGFPTDSEDPRSSQSASLYLLTNTAKFHGASAMLYPNVLLDFAQSMGCDLYILPSSVHEVLLLPKNSSHSLHTSDVNAIVKQVNGAHVSGEELLSNHAYCFERENGFITL